MVQGGTKGTWFQPWSRLFSSLSFLPIHFSAQFSMLSLSLSHKKVILIMYDTNFSILENTRTVSRNLTRKTDSGIGSISSAVDVLIPEVIQVYLSVSLLFISYQFLKIKLLSSDKLLFYVSVNGQGSDFRIYGRDSLKWQWFIGSIWCW